MRLCESDSKNNSIKDINNITIFIKPDNFEIKNANIHHITQEMANTLGIKFSDAMKEIIPFIIGADVLIAHNVLFDKNILLSELFRYKLYDIIEYIRLIPTFCTGMNLRHITNIRHGRYLKIPKLIELYKKLFGCNFPNMHDASGDVTAMVKCFTKLLELKKIIIRNNQIFVVY
jgi:DNA polymerase-3 subunit alpha